MFFGGDNGGKTAAVGSLARPTVIRGGYSLFAFPEQLRAAAGDLRAIVPTTAIFENNPNSATQSPDGLPNYLMRSVPTVIAGRNSKDVLRPRWRHGRRLALQLKALN